MTYERMLYLPDVLMDRGLKVKTYDGWEKRGLSGGFFIPRSVILHHDASAMGPSPSVPRYMINNFQKAGAQTWVDTAGTWHIIASGRAPHAGKVLPGKPSNSTSLGVETDHTANEAWHPALLESTREGIAAILEYWKRGVTSLEFHKTVCSPEGRKIDPWGLELDPERIEVGRRMKKPGITIPNKEEDDMTPEQSAQLDRLEKRQLDLMKGLENIDKKAQARHVEANQKEWDRFGVIIPALQKSNQALNLAVTHISDDGARQQLIGLINEIQASLDGVLKAQS